MSRARRPVLVTLVGVAALWGGVAGADDVPKGKGEKAGGAPSIPESTSSISSQVDTTAATRATGTTASTEEQVSGLFDYRPGMRRKWFDVGISWETHGDLFCPVQFGTPLSQGGYGACATNAGGKKILDFLEGYASLLLSRNDRIRLRAGFYQYFLRDPGESGVRGTDLSLSYSHLFRLPLDFSIRGTVALTAPISFYSQKAGLITAPSASLTVAWSPDRVGLGVDFSVFGSYNIPSCSSGGGYDCTMAGGAPNVQGVLGGSLDVAYAFPVPASAGPGARRWFHRKLALGVDGYVGYLWAYNPQTNQPTLQGCPNYGYGSCMTPGAVTDTQFTRQPAQQVYGFSVYMRYSLPSFYGIRTDLQVALAEGDPTLGWVARNIDGVSHFIGDYWQTFEIYGAISARY